MKSVRLAAAICLSILGLCVPHPAQAAEALLDAQDPAGDVRIYTPDGLSDRDRKSVDIRRAWVSEVDQNTYRVSVKFKRVAAKSTRWDQMVFFDSHPQNEKINQSAGVGFTQKPRSDAYP
ncbi:hypothetical protein, partial [Streptomyces rhizosphaericus]|uniref:hypothetical protein n=1 Tax=Streptomyces rhizosphaericus TaxID=114699 RepID=UPI0031D4A6CC